ncbi:hypothetical protein Baya_12442 [Bagarius yarrelli]|uniref:Uncharacterized protein n=1 Tax=Bagarius yarrelli TaxID=175774 RepID=A0A556V305_BAGYA|nr:hypothetical protein Baya_12442 [Bagarius yarrelli]
MEKYIPMLHLSVHLLKELALQGELPDMRRYIEKQIPPYPTPVEFRVSDVDHVTDESGFEGILMSEQFEILMLKHVKPPESELLWWDLKINKEEIRLAEKCYMENNFPIQPEELNEQDPFLEKFTTSPLFQPEKSRFGNYRFTFPLADLIQWYKEQNCGGEEPVLRVYGTITYKKLIAYAVLIHSPENNEDFEDYPLLETSEWVSYQDGKIIWKAQAICETHWYQFHSGKVQKFNHFEFYVWDQVRFVFHLPNRKTIKIPRKRLIEALKTCEFDEIILSRYPTSKNKEERFKDAKMKVSELKKELEEEGKEEKHQDQEIKDEAKLLIYNNEGSS